MKRTHNCSQVTSALKGQKVCINGWVKTRRDHGGLIFFDVRDRYGFIQVVFPTDNADLFGMAEGIRNEYVVAIKGTVRQRPAGTENPKIKNGDIEIGAESLEIINTSEPPPFEIEDDADISEEVRFTYRYLDIRRAAQMNKLIARHNFIKAVRDFLDERGFIEVETPILTKSTPEGARDYLVPSRVNQGSFFALPQSPQLFKQILMVASLDKYFQIAKCFRDEDLRADRQPEFTQLDLEMSFVDEEDIFAITESLMKFALEKTFDVKINIPFPRISYRDSMERFGNDKPDLRLGLEIIDFSCLFANTKFEVFKKCVESGGRVKGICVPMCSDFSRAEFDQLTEYVKGFKAKGLAYLKFDNDQWSGPVAKFFGEDELNKIKDTSKIKAKDVIFFIADKNPVCCEALSRLRIKLGEKLNLLKGKEKEYRFLWVTEFPLFKYNDEEKRWESEHHPFTSFHKEDAHRLESGDLGNIRSSAYDLVLNGTEISSGSIRIHQKQVQKKIFGILGITDKEADEKFGFLLKAFSYGAPVHGGIAPGIDRILAMFMGTDSIRDVIAFPKTQKAVCPMTNAPSRVTDKQLKELGLKINQ